MNPVYIRLLAYALSTVLGMIPAAWAGWISFDATAQMVQISVPGFAAALAGGLGLSGAIFAKWGVK